MKERLERMEQRNDEARALVEKAEKCLKAVPKDVNGANMFLNDAQSKVNLVKIDIDRLGHERMSDEDYQKMRSIVATNANLNNKIRKLR